MKINWFKLYKLSNNTILTKINNIFLYSQYHNFCDFLIMLKQGFICKDCNEIFSGCKCNYCKECRHDMCVCNFDSTDIFLFIFNFIKYNLSRLNLIKIQNLLKENKSKNAENMLYDLEHL